MRLFPPGFYPRPQRLTLIIIFSLYNIISVQAQTPTITSFSPLSICQGESITITGTNFTDATVVRAGNYNITNFVVNNATTITASIPDLSANGVITVTTPDGIAISTRSLTVLAAPTPALTDVSNPDGPFTHCDDNLTYVLRVINSSATTGTGNVYQINWGDGTTPFTQTDWPVGDEVRHTYNSQGYFSIRMTITPANLCTRSASYQFYNGKNPIASFTTSASTTGLCVPAPVEFQIGNWINNSPGTTYDVDFGDGSPHVVLTHPLSAATHLISHQYTISSCPSIDFKATLNVINGCYITTYTLNQIVIRKKPVVDFTIPAPACVNTPVCFTNETVSGNSGNNCNSTSSFLWDFGDGTTSTRQDPPCHTYTTAGSYTVTLTASNTSCGSDTKTKEVIVKAISPPPVVTTPVAYCEGETAVPLIATGTGLLWYTPAGVVTAAPTPSTNIRGTTTYYVSQTLPNRCESPKVPITVTINYIPDAPATGNVELCQGQPAVPLVAGGTNLLWYTAPVSGTGSSVAPTPSTATVGYTTYFVSQTINGCQSIRAPMLVTVNPLPGAPVVTSPITYCQNQPAVPLTASGTRLLWYTTATGGTGSTTAPTPSTAATGSRIYYVSEVTACGEGPRSTITVNVNTGPSASIIYSPAMLCNSSSTPVTVTHTGTTGGSYSVSPAGLAINAATGVINPSGASAGIYTITYTIPGAGGCSNYTTTATVTVNGAPTATITYPDICTADASTTVTLTGTSGGTYTSTTGLIIDAVTGTITPATSLPGDYTVTYTIAATPPCTGFTVTAPVRISQAPSASISYTPANFCNAASTPVTVTHTGTTGGNYSVSPAGLAIDATTGLINPSGVIPAVYTIKYTVTGTGGCADYNTTTTVTISGAPTATISYREPAYCGSITIPQPILFSGAEGGIFSSGQGLSLNAVTGEINPSLSTPGDYTVTYTITPTAPCPGYVTTTNVKINESPIVTFTTSSQSICSGETAVFIPSSTVANTTYTWSVTGSLPANVAGVSAGTSSGPISLSYTNTGTVSQTLQVQVIPVNPSQPPCAGASYNLALIVKPATPAPVTDTANICMGMPPVALNVPGTDIKWYDNNAVLLNAAPVINTNLAGEFKYYVSQSNSYGCESPQSPIVAIVHPTARIISSSGMSPTTCGIPSGSIVLNVLDLNDGAIPNIRVIVHYNKFQITHTFYGSTDASGKITIPLTAGTYSNISVETSGGCTSQKIPDVFILKDPSPPEKPVAGYNPPLCNSMPLTLTALTATSTQAGPINYVWAGPAFGPFADTVRNTVITFPSVGTSDAGTYVVYAIQNNCISLPADFEIAINQSPDKPVITTRTPLCVGDELLLQAYSSIPGNSSLNYLWKGPAAGFPVNSPNASINKVKIEDAGIYTITVSSPETGCSATSDTLIQIGGNPIVKFAQDTVSLPTGYHFILAPVITNAADPGILPLQNYTWTPSQDLTCNDALCTSPITTTKNNVCYNLKVTNLYGCSGSDTLCVNVFCKNSQVFIPNAFAPGGNVPENKKLMVRATGISSIKSFRIFNRWGKVVFERNNFPPNSADFGWDGMVNGKPADTGVYIYTVDVICENGVPYSFKGNVTLF